MKTLTLFGLVAVGSLFALDACSSNEGAPANAAGTTSNAGTGGGSAGAATGGSSAGMAAGGTVSSPPGGTGIGTGAGGAATAGGGAGGAAGAAGTAGSGGGSTVCDPGTGKAIALKGNKIDYIAGDLGDDLPGGNAARTLELWAHFLGDASWKGEGTVIELGRGGGNRVFGIDMDGRKDATTGIFDPYTAGLGDNAGTQVPSPPEAWHHLAWSYDGAGKFQFVVDGKMVTIPHPMTTGSLVTAKGIISLGASQCCGAQGWEGEMDEVRVWSVARTPDDILRDMKVKLKGSEAGLVAYYNLDEGTGSSADDIKKAPGHKLSFCAAKAGACNDQNEQAPTWVDSKAPGPFTCAN